ncbi:MAG: energy transducer TonB [Saprospiraceae bacterium]|nr:energy transducer TonB [Saprospiraceae bacterium]
MFKITFFLLLASCFFAAHLSASNIAFKHTSLDTLITETDSIYEMEDLDIKPQYGEGSNTTLNFMRHIQKTVEYPTLARENSLQGFVILKFVIEKDGSVGEIVVLKTSHKCFTDEAIRSLNLCDKFKPGVINGEPVRSWYSYHTVFKLAN